MSRYKSRHIAQSQSRAVRLAPRDANRRPHIQRLLEDGWMYLIPSYDEGKLTEEELLVVARDKFFMPYDVVAARWDKITQTDLASRHTDACWSDHLISYSSANAEGSAAKGSELQIWMRLSSLARMGPAAMHAGTVRAQLKQHQAVCGICNAHLTRLSAHVLIEWAGFTLAREYALRPVSKPSTQESTPPP